MNLRHHSGAWRRNRTNRLLSFQLHEGLVFFNLLAFGNQNADDCAGLYAFGELRKFDVHAENIAVIESI
jgi:hypothetical protein